MKEVNGSFINPWRRQNQQANFFRCALQPDKGLSVSDTILRRDDLGWRTKQDNELYPPRFVGHRLSNGKQSFGIHLPIQAKNKT